MKFPNAQKKVGKSALTSVSGYRYALPRSHVTVPTFQLLTKTIYIRVTWTQVPHFKFHCVLIFQATLKQGVEGVLQFTVELYILSKIFSLRLYILH